MEDIFELLASTQNAVILEIETPGIQLEEPLYITSVEKFDDGVTLYTRSQGKISLSNLACTPLQRVEDGNMISYSIKTALGAILTITIVG